MDGIYLSIFEYLLTISIISLLLLQLLPKRYTFIEDAIKAYETWRPLIWALPWHMLSGTGKALRVTFYLFSALALLVLDISLFL